MNALAAAANTQGAHWRRLSLLMDELLELEPGPRVGRLLEVQRSDPELAVEASHWLVAGVQAERAGFLVGEPEQAAAQTEGSRARVGAYRLLQPIGRGSSSSVWRAARTQEHPDAAVAVKLAHRALAGQSQVARFAREAEVLARLASPHIAQLLDAGVTANAQPYLVLELVLGERIDRFCDRRALPIAARIDLFLQACAAVTHAHHQGVAHGDLKPSNVLVDPQGRVKLLDFGLAHLLDPSAAASTLCAESGSAGLTPAAAAPERLRGEAPTPASDQYALGALLYGLLAGGHPVAPEGASPAQMLHAVLARAPRALWHVAGDGVDACTAAQRARLRGLAGLRQWRCHLRGAIDEVARRAVQREPAQRHTSVAAFSEALQRLSVARQPGSSPALRSSAPRDLSWRRRAASLAKRAVRFITCAAATAFAREPFSRPP
jgi:serine/threonine-protein kinase